MRVSITCLQVVVPGLARWYVHLKPKSPIKAKRSLVHHSIVCLCTDWHGCELREGLGGLCWGCLSDCLRTKHLLWPVIKALGNNRHDIHLDKHTCSAGCVRCSCLLECMCTCSHLQLYAHTGKTSRRIFFKTFRNILDKSVLKLFEATGKVLTVLQSLRCFLRDPHLCWIGKVADW